MSRRVGSWGVGRGRSAGFGRTARAAMGSDERSRDGRLRSRWDGIRWEGESSG